MKSSDNKKFVPSLGFKKSFVVNVKSTGLNEDNILFYITDGICIDELTQISTVGKEPDKEPNFEFKRYDSSSSL